MMAYHNKYKKILDEIWKDNEELDGKIIKEVEEAVKRIKGEALKEKDDPGAFIFPIRLEGKGWDYIRQLSLMMKDLMFNLKEFISKIARKLRVLTNDVLRSLSTLVYCRDLDTTKLRELIESESRLILEDPRPGVPRVSIPRPPSASMQDFYDRMVGWRYAKRQ
nr:hypothetical protein [Tanacetum cinerariifolium]